MAANIDGNHGMLQGQALAPFPAVAVELVRYVIEIAAQEDRRTALSLARVSKALHDWVTPIIYHSVILSGVNQIDAFKHAMFSELRWTVPCASVRHLVLLGHPRRLNFQVETLCICVNLETLVTDVAISLPPGFETPQIWPAPSQVMLVARRWPQVTARGHPLLRKATHVYVDYASVDLRDPFVSLPCLTHVGFGVWDREVAEEWVRVVTCMLSKESLKSILIHAMDELGPKDLSPEWEIWIELAKVKDERLVVCPAVSMERHVALAGSRETIWEDATETYKDWRKLVVEG